MIKGISKVIKIIVQISLLKFIGTLTISHLNSILTFLVLTNIFFLIDSI